MASAPLLTICIPTYNRASHLEKLLATLVHSVLPMGKGDIEILVVNNCSKDNTKNILDKIAHPAVRVVHRDVFLLTAEENIIHSLDYCRGDYVWFLGDDDVPVLSNLSDHLDRLRKENCDYYFFNPALVDKDGALFTSQTLRMNREVFIGTTVDVVLLAGCLFTFAGISNHIIRRTLLSSERGKHYLATSRIYSMVAWMIEAGSKANVAMINRPLVYYRENDYSDGHWERTAKRMDVGDYYFWSMGLVELFTQLVASGCMTYYQIGLIFDVTRDGSRYRLLDDMLFKMHQQMGKAYKSHEKRQKLSDDQMQKFGAFCMLADPLCYDLVEVLKDMNQVVATRSALLQKLSFAQLEQRFRKLFAARQTLGQWVCRVQQLYCGFEILWTPMQYVAVLAGDASFRDAVMKVVDPSPQMGSVLVDMTREGLLQKITMLREQPQNGDMQGVPVATAVMATQQLAAATQRISDLYNSNSWLVTAPFRAVKIGVLRLIGQR